MELRLFLELALSGTRAERFIEVNGFNNELVGVRHSHPDTFDAVPSEPDLRGLRAVRRTF